MMTEKNTVSGTVLRSFIERVEVLEKDKKAIAEDIKQVFGEAKSSGLSPLVMKNIIKRRKARPADLEEHDSLMDMYQHSLGMLPEAPLFRAVGLMDVDINARESVIDAMKLLVPDKGEIIVKIGDSPVVLTRAKGKVVVRDYVEPKVHAPASPASKPPSPGNIVNVPECTIDEAKGLGRQAYRENQPIISNPFPAGDERRPAFDLGWREESGGEGMGE